MVCWKDFDNLCLELFGEGWNRIVVVEIKMMILKYYEYDYENEIYILFCLKKKNFYCEW